jgi:hypothetical protein
LHFAVIARLWRHSRTKTLQTGHQKEEKKQQVAATLSHHRNVKPLSCSIVLDSPGDHIGTYNGTTISVLLVVAVNREQSFTALPQRLLKPPAAAVCREAW